jgi:diaminopimelate decarboxylase
MIAAEPSALALLSVPDGALVAAAREFGTPVYVLDLATVAAAAALMEAAFPKPWIRQYSLKANDLPAVAGYLAQRGWGANVVSLGEWHHASAAGVPNGRVSLEGIGKTDAELEHAVRQTAAGRPLRWLAIESPDEAERLTEIAVEHSLGVGNRPPLDVLVRVNPDVAPETRPQFAVGARSSKFGMDVDEIHALVRGGLGSAGRGGGGALRLRGVHVHTGSDLGDVAAWAEAGVNAVTLASELAALVDTVDTVDVGGGFPMPVDDAPRPAQFVAALHAGLERRYLTLPPRHAIEPGRSLVGHAGWLVSAVLHSRPRPHLPQQTVLDAGMTELVRPALYGSRHDIRLLEPPGAAPSETVRTSVEGPICELTDSFGTYQLPRLRRGDLVAIEQAGAYASSFTSRYNGRPQPREVLLRPDGSLQLCQRPAYAAMVPDSHTSTPSLREEYR